MKPKNLKYPFTWEKRHVHIEDRVWYVPVYYDRYQEFQFPGWSDAKVFGNNNPVRVEYCSGNGTWLAAKAQLEPEFNWLGVELQFKRVRKIWSKVKNCVLNNVMTLCGEAYTSTRYFFPDHSVDDMYINFPDPWPKDKHAKHRLMHEEFVNEMWRALKLHGTVNLVTDDPDYSDQMVREMLRHEGFRSCYDEPYYITERPGYGVSSFFEDLWRSKGKTIRYHKFEKISMP